ncbi:ParB/RepB/Spo0J family partition protein [Verrucomicrobiota bacterium]
MAVKKRGLGRGLGALMQDSQSQAANGGSTQIIAQTAQRTAAAPSSDTIKRVPLSKIMKSQWQPRREFNQDALNDLVESIKEHGVLQPLLVRPNGTKLELIAGERRFRASTEAQLKEVPVIIMDADDRKVLEIALIENLQREDLNPIEEAEGYRELQEKFNMTQAEISQQVGKGRATVANALRLLDLDKFCRKLVAEGDISAGHAKVLLSVDIEEERTLLAKKILKEGLSVRALEKLVAKMKRPTKKPRAFKTDLPEEYLTDLNDKLHQHFGTGIRLNPTKTLANGKKTKGSIEIDFYNNDDLHRLLTLFGMAEEDY